MRRPSVSCLLPVLPIQSQNNRKLVKTTNQIKWMRSVWLRISVSAEYRLRSDMEHNHAPHAIPDMVQAKCSLPNPSAYSRRRDTFGLLVDSFIIHLAFATVCLYLHSYFPLLYPLFSLFSLCHQVSVFQFGFSLTHTFLRFVGSVSLWRTPHPHVRSNL